MIPLWAPVFVFGRLQLLARALFAAEFASTDAGRSPGELVLTCGILLILCGLWVSSLPDFIRWYEVERWTMPPSWLVFLVCWPLALASTAVPFLSGRWAGFYVDLLWLVPVGVFLYRCEVARGKMSPLLVEIGIGVLVSYWPLFLVMEILYRSGLAGDWLVVEHNMSVTKAHLNMLLVTSSVTVAAVEAMIGLTMTGRMPTLFRRRGSDMPMFWEKALSEGPAQLAGIVFRSIWGLLGQAVILGSLSFAFCGWMLPGAVMFPFWLAVVIGIHYLISTRPLEAEISYSVV